jgi:RNA polymerase sigma factor (sigma-70 family)
MSRFLDIPVDETCLRLAAGGDRTAQRQLYEQVAGPVFALIRRLVSQRVVAEDIFQDCMVSLLRHLPAFRGEAPFGAWVRQIALRHCLMHQRSPWQRARRALESVVGTDEARDSRWRPVQDAPSGDMIDLERALARLPDVARTVVWMHDVEGLDHAEIAALYGRSVSFSKSQLSRAHALLRTQLEEVAGPIAVPVVSAQGQVP